MAFLLLTVAASYNTNKEKDNPVPGLLYLLVFTLDTSVRDALNVICRRDFSNLDVSHLF